jgi:RNA polymerase sigma-70 factor, ECF subfamily
MCSPESPATLEPPAIAVFQEQRPRLLRIADRIVGTRADAEDVVQEAFIRWFRADRSAVENPAGFLATTVTRLAINASRAAHRRRVDYVGLDLEALGGAGSEPERPWERAKELSAALLRLIEELGPVERAVLLLHQVFDYPYAEISALVGKSEANCRQIERRARQRLATAAGRLRGRQGGSEALARLKNLFGHAAEQGGALLVAHLGAEARTDQPTMEG